MLQVAGADAAAGVQLRHVQCATCCSPTPSHAAAPPPLPSLQAARPSSGPAHYADASYLLRVEADLASSLQRVIASISGHEFLIIPLAGFHEQRD
jgi:hypothetical protein